MRFLISYDIPKNKTRTKISQMLDGYGVRVNFSVYECVLSKTELKRLKTDILALIKPKSDNVRFYRICENCLAKSFRLAKREKSVFQGVNLVF